MKAADLIPVGVIGVLATLLWSPHEMTQWQRDAASERVDHLWKVAQRSQHFVAGSLAYSWDNPRDWGGARGSIAVTLCPGLLIVFDPAWAADEWDHFLSRTIPHEVAHAAVCAMGDHPDNETHGPEWERIFDLLRVV